MSVWRSLASSMGRMELRRVEMRAELRLHIAPKTLSSSSRRDTRCSWTTKRQREKATHTMRLATYVAAAMVTNLRKVTLRPLRRCE